MIVQRKRNREIVISSLLNTIPDVLIAGGAAYYFDGGLLGFVGVIVGLQAVYLVLWVKNSLWGWVRYKLGRKKQIFQTLLDFLVENKFPKPANYVDSAEMYFDDVAADEEVDIEIRLKAAIEIGTINYLRHSMKVQELLYLTLAYDNVIEEYHRRFGET